MFSEEAQSVEAPVASLARVDAREGFGDAAFSSLSEIVELI